MSTVLPLQAWGRTQSPRCPDLERHWVGGDGAFLAQHFASFEHERESTLESLQWPPLFGTQVPCR